MQDVLNFDELNQLEKTHRSIPYEEYFGVMDIDAKEKQKLIDMAKDFEEEFLFILGYLWMAKEYDALEEYAGTKIIADSYRKALSKEKMPEEYEYHIEKFAKNLYNSIVETSGLDDYAFSDDRAKFMAENEAMSAYNASAFEKARSEGYAYKTWHSVLDGKERLTHGIADGQKVPIDGLFDVGGFSFAYPRDMTYDPPASEIVNCRCFSLFSRN